MSERLTVNKVLDEAQRQLDEFDPHTSGAWPHASAALIRQSLERTLDVFWNDKAPGMLETSARDRWVCLPAYLGDKPEAREADFACAPSKPTAQIPIVYQSATNAAALSSQCRA